MNPERVYELGGGHTLQLEDESSRDSQLRAVCSSTQQGMNASVLEGDLPHIWYVC